MKKTFYYLLSTFLLFIFSMQGVNAASSEILVDERIRAAVSALHPSVHAEALKHTQRLYTNQPGKLKTILSLLGELENLEASTQLFAVIHVACMDNVSDMGDVVDSWCQVNGIENAALRELAITCMKEADSLQDINNVGNAWNTLGKIENPEIQLEALNRMLATRSTKQMNTFAEEAADEDDELNEMSDN